jgi:hypothetical protein
MIVAIQGWSICHELSNNEQAIVWVHQDRASSTVVITGFIAVFAVAMALAMV